MRSWDDPEQRQQWRRRASHPLDRPAAERGNRGGLLRLRIFRGFERPDRQRCRQSVRYGCVCAEPCGANPGPDVEDTRCGRFGRHAARSEEHTSELQSLMRISYAVFCLKKKMKAFLRIVSTK